MTLSQINDTKHWRDRAAEMRALSDMMEDAEAVAIMACLLCATTPAKRSPTFFSRMSLDASGGEVADER